MITSIYQEVELSLTENLIPVTVPVKQYDNRARKVRCGYQVHGQQGDSHIPGGKECVCLPPYKWYTVRADETGGGKQYLV